MRRQSETLWWLPALLCAAAAVGAQESQQPPPSQSNEQTVQPEPEQDHAWLDKTQQGVEHIVSKSAEHLDRLFGPEDDEAAYKAVAGSLAPALLWDEFDGWQPKLRFHVDLPLPQLDQRWNAFIGRVNRDEYVSERAPQSGAFERQYGPASDEQTLAGVTYHTPEKQGSRFDAGAGMRLRFPLDPYLKGSYVYEVGKSDTGLMSLRETVFWQNSEHAGVTTRADLERAFFERWLVRWTTSATISQKSEGVFGYSSVRALRGFPNRRAVAVEIGFDGATDQEVPLHEYGIKAAYRQSVLRDWLVLELRSSFTYPKEFRWQPRKPSWGAGIGFEMFFGTDEFLARPMTF
jgi:hypothetical protein